MEKISPVSPKRNSMKKILIIQLANSEKYPPVAQMYHLLKGRGYDVKIFCVKDGEGFGMIQEDIVYLGKTSRTRILNRISFSTFYILSYLRGLIYRPHLVIVVDFKAVLAGLALAKILSVPLIYYCLDIGVKNELMGIQKLLLSIERNFSKYFNLIIFPEENMAKFFRRETGIRQKIMVVYNAVSKNTIPSREISLKSILAEKGYTFKWIIFRHGGIGDNHCMEESILAMEHLPKEAGLVLAGYSNEEYLKKIKQLILQRNLEKRVLLLGILQRKEILELLPSVDIGLALYKPTSINKKFYGTGAVKLAEYIASGIPSVVNDNKIMRELNKKVGSFVFANPYSPESIANAVKEVINNPGKAKKLGQNARRAFETFYNFEYQFEPVLREIERWIGR